MIKLNRNVIVTFMVVLCVFAGFSAVKINADSKIIRDGVSIEGVDVSQMTEEEAEKAIKKYVNEMKAVKVNIDVNGKSTKTTIGDLGYTWLNTEVVKDAVDVGKKGNVIRRYKDELDIDNNGKQFKLEMKITEEDIATALEELCTKFHMEAKDASLKLTSAGFEIIPEEAGVAVDYKKTSKDIYKYITEKWDKKSDVKITADTKVDEPEYTVEDLELISDVPMGKYTTTFSTGSSYYNRNMNIKNGAYLLDGAVVYPDKEYSLNDHLAPWTEENGYYPAGTYVDGGVTDSLGGGICQVSSTLYNALLLAEIEIVERYPHSMSVAYVPLAADAALAGDYKDLVFKNNTDAPIYIEAVYTEGAITFNVYGHDTRKEGRTIKYVSETVSTKKIKTEVKEDKTKYEDYEEVISEGHTGYVAKLWKYIYQDGEEVEKELVNTSSYRMSPKQVVKGTKKKKDEDKNKDKDKEKESSKDNGEEKTQKINDENTENTEHESKKATDTTEDSENSNVTEKPNEEI